MAFEPVKALYGHYLPTLVRIVAWPSSAEADARQRDPRTAELDAWLDSAAPESTRTLMRPHPRIHAQPDQFEVSLDGTLSYEISTFWDRVDAPHGSWDAFVQAVSPSIDRHGGHPLLVFAPLRCERGDFSPDRLCLAAWQSLAHFEGFISAPEHEEISRLRWIGVERMDATATRLR